MRKLNRKLLSALSAVLSTLILLGTLCFLPAGAAETDSLSVAAKALNSEDGFEAVGASHTATIDGVTYSLNEIDELGSEFVSISSISGYTKSLHIPSIINGYYIVGIEENVIFNNSSLESITVDNGILYINQKNFSGCTNLKTINLPDSMLVVNADFSDTLHYQNNSNWKDGVYYVSNHAIEGSLSRSSIKIREGTKSIASGFIISNSNLTSISLPGSLECVGAVAFLDCPNLKSVTIPGSILLIGDYAFGWKYVNKADKLVNQVKNFTIYGARKSTAEEYALTYDFNFVTASVPVSTPILLSTQSVNNGVKITWHSVLGAEKYRVFYKGKSGWKSMGDTKDLSFIDTDVNSGSSYTYTVRCVSSDGKTYCSDYDHTGIVGKYIAPPALKSTECINNGVKITWGAVKGASKYRVFYKSGSTWKSMGDTTDTSFVDTVVTSGKSYTYTVRCISSDGKSYVSGYDSKGIVGTFVTAPKITKFENTNDGVKITWSPSAGAAKYRVYYKGSKGWTRFGETTGTSFTDTDVNSGKTYSYTVRCVDKNGNFTSGYNSTGWKQTYIAVPQLTKAENTTNGVKLSWNKVAGATKYRVFYKSGNTWKGMGNTSDTSFVDTVVTSGKSYTYTVRCIDNSGNYISGYNSTGLKHTFVGTPKITDTKNTSDGIKLSWNKVAGAAQYRVFIKSESGWKGLGNTSGTSFTDKNVKLNGSYTYTVRCLDSKGNFISGYDNTGVTQKYTK